MGAFFNMRLVRAGFGVAIGMMIYHAVLKGMVDKIIPG